MPHPVSPTSVRAQGPANWAIVIAAGETADLRSAAALGVAAETRVMISNVATDSSDAFGAKVIHSISSVFYI